MTARTASFTPYGSTIALAVGGALVLGFVALTRQPAAPLPEPVPLVAMPSAPGTEAERRDRDIAFYTARVSQDAQGATDRIALAGLLFTRSRITGSAGDLARAESLARESVALRPERNGHAFEVLASILMARHAFAEARIIAARADSLEPGTPSHLALLGEIELELGEYDAAATHFHALDVQPGQFTVTARLARWYELTGHADVARTLLRRAAKDADGRDDLPREQVAWFHYRLGELELRTGHVDAAESAFQRSLHRNAADVRALGGLARAALSRRDWRAALRYGDSALAIQIDPAVLGTLSDAATHLGDSASAAGYANAMSVSALRQPGAIHRAWGLHLLDHGTPADRAEVLRRARAELGVRRDVYGHDLLAWALHRAGRTAEARDAMRLALAQHTEDVLLAAHADSLGIRPGTVAMR